MIVSMPGETIRPVRQDGLNMNTEMNRTGIILSEAMAELGAKKYVDGMLVVTNAGYGQI